MSDVEVSSYESPPRLIVDSNGYTPCPTCEEKVHVGASNNFHNLKAHEGSAKCRQNVSRKAKAKSVKNSSAKLTTWLTSRPTVSKVPPMVIDPQPLQSAPPPPASSSGRLIEPAADDDILPLTSIPFLLDLRNRINRLPAFIPEAGIDHPFSQFSGDLTSCVPDGEDAWEFWDGPLNTILQKERAELRQLVARGSNGLLAFYRFLVHLSTVHHVDSVLFENKVERIISAIDDVVGASDDHFPIESTSCPQDPSPSRSTTDHDVIILSDSDSLDKPVAIHRTSKQKVNICKGLKVEIPAGQTPHGSYPILLHQRLGDPWDLIYSSGSLRVQARDCSGRCPDHLSTCLRCQAIQKNANFSKIIQRMHNGVKRHSPHYFHGPDGMVLLIHDKDNQIRVLRLNRVNDARKLVGKIKTISLHKEFLMAVASGTVERVDRLVKAALDNNRGIQGIIDMFEAVDNDIYRTNNYPDKDMNRGRLLWRLGGARLADINHRALGLPSTRTLRRHSSAPRYISSPGKPLVSEVEVNVSRSIESLLVIIEQEGIVHQVLMFDEIKVEERPRWDEESNYIQGICREHGDRESLNYTSDLEVDELFEQIMEEKVHFSTNATIGAIGILSNNHRLYSALPALISGQCGKESGREHANVLQTTLNGCKKSRLRTICIASDGESRRHDALVRLTFKHELQPDSSIYLIMSSLPFMNLEVGDDDITADKDFKHVFKRCRNLCIRKRGVKLHGNLVLISTFQSHFLDNGIEVAHMDSILKPDDKQDVKLAYDLLREIWLLPPASSSLQPGFADTREALRTLGAFFRHILLPYICIDLDLSEQLIHLSTAAHMLLAMWHEGAGSAFMPSQLYIDIQIMIKNVYFCVAKTLVDNPSDNFYLILLGTDRLEELFGILRTMVGGDSSVDMLQLVLRLGGTSEVSSILANHPEWDRSPRRLNLPALAKDGLDVHKGVDHIKPSSWRGNVSVANVNLRTCWQSGRRKVGETPRLNAILQRLELEENPSVNMLQPFGKDILRTSRSQDDYDDTAEDFNDSQGGGESSGATHALDTSIEEAAIEENPPETHRAFFEKGDKKIWKGRYLSECFKQFKNPNSRDRLKRNAAIPRYALKNDSNNYVIREDNDNLSGVRINMPVASVLKCAGGLFVCVGEVLDIVHDSKHVSQISQVLLGSDGVFITYQLLYIVPATVEDDPELKNDWRWSFERGSHYKVAGILIEPLDPDICTREAGKPTYLFDTLTLQGLGNVFLEKIAYDTGLQIPTSKVLPLFPYRAGNGSACFSCKAPNLEGLLYKQCPLCKCDLPKAPPKVLEHMGAHVLCDSSLSSVSEPCGLCLRPSPACTFYLTKGKGANASPKVDYGKSSCANLIQFRYGTAATSAASSPCTNVPMPCNFCPASTPAVWKYNMKAHLQTKHPHVRLNETRELWELNQAEKDDLKEIWKARKTVKKTRMSKKKIIPLVISEAHCSDLTLLNSTLSNDHNLQTLVEAEEDNPYELTDNLDFESAGSDNDDLEGGDSDSDSLEGDSSDDTEGDYDDDPVAVDAFADLITNELDTDAADCSPTNHRADDHDNQYGFIEGSSSPPPVLAATVTSSSSRSFARSPAAVLMSNDDSEDEEEVLPAKRRAKKRQVVLNECTCGEVLAKSDSDIIKCSRKGCETEWYHLRCVNKERQPRKGWVCEACKTSTRKDTKRARRH